jgi:hypothetical protein
MLGHDPTFTRLDTSSNSDSGSDDGKIGQELPAGIEGSISLLEKKPVMIYLAKDGRIYLHQYPRRSESPSTPCKESTIWLTAAGLILMKLVASIGQRFYNVHDALNNKSYFLHDILFQYIPGALKNGVTIYVSMADGWMNGFTRGPATKKLVKTWFEDNKRERHRLNSNVERLEPLPKTKYRWVIFSGYLSSVTASLATYLGMATVVLKFTDNKLAVVTFSSFVGVANFFSNLSYRQKKAVDNFVDYTRDPSLRPEGHKKAAIYLATAAFTGQCFYGGCQSLKTLFESFHTYNDQMKVPFMFLSFLTLPSSVTTYFYAQGVTMMHKPRELPGAHLETGMFDLARLYYREMSGAHGKKILRPFSDESIWASTNLLFFGVVGTYLSIFGEMLGNGIGSFNGCMDFGFTAGQGVQWALKKSGASAIDAPWMSWVSVGVSCLLTSVFSWIYWRFNVKPWIENVKCMTAKCMVNSLCDAGILSGDTSNDYAQLATMLASLHKRPGMNAEDSMTDSVGEYTLFGGDPNDTDHSDQSTLSVLPSCHAIAATEEAEPQLRFCSLM